MAASAEASPKSPPQRPAAESDENGTGDAIAISDVAATPALNPVASIDVELPEATAEETSLFDADEPEASSSALFEPPKETKSAASLGLFQTEPETPAAEGSLFDKSSNDAAM